MATHCLHLDRPVGLFSVTALILATLGVTVVSNPTHSQKKDFRSLEISSLYHHNSMRTQINRRQSLAPAELQAPFSSVEHELVLMTT